MKITVIGTGYVGLVASTCLANAGNDVVGVDVDPAVVARLSGGKSPIFEPGLERLLAVNLRAKRLRFTTDFKEAVAHGQVIVVTIGTPPLADGSADTSSIERACRDIAAEMAEPKIIVIKSTVPVGTGDRIERCMRRMTSMPLSAVSNPEFLREGSAVADFMNPHRIIIGAEDPDAAQTLHELYAPFVREHTSVLTMRRSAAEMSKYAANCYLATRISFINEIAILCQCCGVDVDEVCAGMGTDPRIGRHFLRPGVGYGGSCFPKDVQALEHLSRQAGVPSGILRATHRANRRQRNWLFHMIAERFGSSLNRRTIAIWGVTFKPETDDLRESPAVHVIERLLACGAAVRVHDPQGLINLRCLYGDRLSYFDDAYAAAEGADALVILTEWEDFLQPDFDRLAAALRHPVIYDGRNIYRPQDMARRPFEYYSIGRPPMNGLTTSPEPLRTSRGSRQAWRQPARPAQSRPSSPEPQPRLQNAKLRQKGLL